MHEMLVGFTPRFSHSLAQTFMTELSQPTWDSSGWTVFCNRAVISWHLFGKEYVFFSFQLKEFVKNISLSDSVQDDLNRLESLIHGLQTQVYAMNVSLETDIIQTSKVC